jgi:hypothetical protein
MADKQPFQLARTQALAIAAIVTAVSVVGLLLIPNLEAGPLATGLTSVASVLLSLGVITVLYEVFLRGSFTAELLSLVGIARNLHDVGLHEVVKEQDIDWEAVLGGCKRFRVLLLDPAPWVDREWPRVLQSGRDHSILVDVILPSPTGPSLVTLASQLGFDVDDFRQRADTALNVVEEGWKNAGLVSRSRLNLHLFEAVPGYGLVLADDKAVVLLSSTAARQPAESMVALRFQADARVFPVAWFHSQLDRMQQTAPWFSNEVP